MERLKQSVKKVPVLGKVAVRLYRKAKRNPYAIRTKQINQLTLQMKFVQSNLKNIALALADLKQELNRESSAPQKIDSATQLRNLHTKSTLCTQNQFMIPEHVFWSKQIKEEPSWNRKQWEYYFICQALWERDMLKRDRRGCGFGVGKEPLPALFANFGCKIVATDAPPSETIIELWEKTGQFARSLEDLNVRGIAPKEVFERNVSFQAVDMNSIPSDLMDFDFIWSTSALEHLGSLSKAIQFLVNSSRCLKPGGVAVHTTEFNVSSNDKTIESGSLVLFRRKDIEEVGAKLKEIGCEMLPVNFDHGEGVLDKFVGMPPYDLPNLKMVIGEFVTTSIALIVRA